MNRAQHPASASISLALATLATLFVLSACTPSTYVPRDLEHNTGQPPEHRTPIEQPTRPPEIERPVIDLPPVVRPTPPVAGPDCKVVELPARARWARIVKCPGEPARKEAHTEG